MKLKNRIYLYVIYIVIGGILVGLSFAGKVDEYWNGMGSALMILGVIMLIKHIRIRNNKEYSKKIEVELSDERNHFIRNKSWAWAGYWFVLIEAASGIVLKIMGHDELSLMASYTVCLMLLLYWGSYLFLKRKY